MMIRKLLLYWALPAVMLVVSACLSSDGSLSSENQPPTISGNPPVNAVLDTQYSFTPAASDPEGDLLTFSISNLPTWASFDTGSGSLSGMPAMQHIGTYENISISVSDGQNNVSLPTFDISVVSVATGSVSLSWTPPTQSADGSALVDLASYRIRWGTRSGDYPNLRTVDNPGISRFVIDGLAPGSYFFIVSAVDSSNNESQPSNEASGSVP